MPKNKQPDGLKGTVLLLVILILTTLGSVFHVFALSYASQYCLLKEFLRKKEECNLLACVEQIIEQIIRSNIENQSTHNIFNSINVSINKLNKTNKSYKVRIKEDDVKVKKIDLMPKVFRTEDQVLDEDETLPLSLYDFNQRGMKMALAEDLKIKIELELNEQNKKMGFVLRVRCYLIPIINFSEMAYGLYGNLEVKADDQWYCSNVFDAFKGYLYERKIPLSNLQTAKYPTVKYFPNCFRHDIVIRGNVFRRILKPTGELLKNQMHFSFSQPNVNIDGFEYSVDGKSVTIDLDQIKESIVLVYDTIGGRRISIKGASTGLSKYIFIRNNEEGHPSDVECDVDFQTPMVVQLENCNFKAANDFNGALILCPKSKADESVRIRGHVSYHINASRPKLLETENKMNDLIDFSYSAVLVTTEWVDE